MIHERNWGSRLFDTLNITLLVLFALSTVLPFIHVVSSSLADPTETLSRDFMLFPTRFTLDAYRFIFSTDRIIVSLMVTVFLTVTGTLVNLMMSALMAYPLSRRDLIGRKPVMMLVTFTLLFSGGMIPSYLIVKGVGLLDSLWSLIIPSAISTFNLIILKNFFQQMPEGIEESAKIDGANDLRILVSIILPLSLPAMATLGLFYAVGHWNTFMSAILYIRDSEKWPIQVLLRSFVLLSQGQLNDSSNLDQEILLPPETVKMAVITVATVPILCVYPFLQKHFAKGVMLGSVKG